MSTGLVNITQSKAGNQHIQAVVQNTQGSKDLAVLSQNSLQLQSPKDKPTMSIFPIDRVSLECYITRAYGALVSHGANKVWAREKAREWKKMGHPRKVIPDILKYVNIRLETVKPHEYFAD